MPGPFEILLLYVFPTILLGLVVWLVAKVLRRKFKKMKVKEPSREEYRNT
jgi:cytochrome c-type biogenesis protein CcmH/NrfF